MRTVQRHQTNAPESERPVGTGSAHLEQDSRMQTRQVQRFPFCIPSGDTFKIQSNDNACKACREPKAGLCCGERYDASRCTHANWPPELDGSRISSDLCHTPRQTKKSHSLLSKAGYPFFPRVQQGHQNCTALRTDICFIKGPCLGGAPRVCSSSYPLERRCFDSLPEALQKHEDSATFKPRRALSTTRHPPLRFNGMKV